MEKVDYDKDAYIAKKKKQLSEAYDKIERGCEDIKLGNNNFFKTYLDVQSKFDKYTFRNAILIAQQFPKAAQLKDFNSWKELGAEFKSYPINYITVLEPGHAYMNCNGEMITPYNPKQLIDISSTNLQQTTRDYDKKLILQALIQASDIEIKAIDELKEFCKWNKDENIVFIERCENIDKIICNVIKEVAKFKIYCMKGEISNNKASCVSYMICKKYNINYSGEDISNIYTNIGVNTIKDELKTIKDTLDIFTERISLYLFEKSKDTKDKSKER